MAGKEAKVKKQSCLHVAFQTIKAVRKAGTYGRNQTGKLGFYPLFENTDWSKRLHNPTTCSAGGWLVILQ